MPPSMRAFDHVVSRLSKGYGEPWQAFNRQPLPSQNGGEQSDSRATNVCQNSAHVSGRARCIWNLLIGLVD